MSPKRKTKGNNDEQGYPRDAAGRGHVPTWWVDEEVFANPGFGLVRPPGRAPSCLAVNAEYRRIRRITGILRFCFDEGHGGPRRPKRTHSRPREDVMNVKKLSNVTVKREAWGRLRKLPCGRWQVRCPGLDGVTYTARTDQNKLLTFLTKIDARVWLAGVQTKMARGLWEPPGR